VLPRLSAGGQFYRLTLALLDPVTLIFQVAGAELLEGTSFTAAGFDGATGTLKLPVVNVGNAKYNLEMTIIADSSPIQFQLSKISLL
jgi:hypothetical protein